MDELLDQFLIEARDLIAQAGDDLAALGRDAGDRARIDSAFRAFHTLKGSVALFDMAAAGRVLHAAEDMLDGARRNGAILDSDNLEALTEVLDQTDRWVDAMAADEALPANASEVADALVGMLTNAEAGAGPEWLPALIARQAEAAPGGELTAFRYVPDADCFFRGDDPLAIVAAVPDLVALDILPREPWPALDAFEPYHCAVAIEGLSAAGIKEIRAAFRFVADQVELTLVSEQAAEAIEQSGTAAQILRVDAGRIDALANGVGELIVASNAFTHVAREAERIDSQIGAGILAAQASLERAVGEMRRAVMAVRSVSLAPSLRRLPRMVREVAAAVGKSIVFEMRGETTEVDKAIADALYEPLLHLVRNAVDHGIESEDARHAAGKPPAGTIQLEIRQAGNGVSVALTDDGAGIDPTRIRAVAVERGVVDADTAAALDDAQALRLIFAPGFSTAAAVTAVSGRGVGMDAVQTAVEQLGGKVEIASALGVGTTIRLRLPLNAIMTRLLVVRSGGDRYGIPLDRIIETVNVPTENIIAVGAGRACVLRNRTLPVLSLAALLGGEETAPPAAKLLVTESATEPVGIIVDGFGERIDGLVRPRAGLLAGVPGVAGTTLLGDGGVLIVLDLAELVG